MALPNGAGGYQFGDGNETEINMVTQVTPTAKVAAATLTAAELATRTRDAGLWISALGPKYARLVTHLDFDDEQCKAAIEILKRALVA